MIENSNSLDKLILKKSEPTPTIKLLRISLLIIFLYFIYMIAINIITEKLDVKNENLYFTSLALEWTVPNVRSDFNFRVTDEELSIFGTKKFSYNLVKTVGGDITVIGEAKVKKSWTNRFSNFEYSHFVQQKLTDISITMPKDPRTGRELRAETVTHVWQTLEMLHEGTVAELAFSTTDFMEPAQLLETLEEYDIHVLWMPLYTGEFKYYEPSSYSWSSNKLWVPGLGLTAGKDHDDEYHENMRGLYLTKDGIEASEQLMLKNMGELLNKSEDYYEQFLGLRHLREQYAYLNEEGFMIYGAVATGPVKELLKLKNLSIIQNEQLGEVELWNWK